MGSKLRLLPGLVPPLLDRMLSGGVLDLLPALSQDHLPELLNALKAVVATDRHRALQRLGHPHMNAGLEEVG